jgi:hypothetical protein
VAGEETVCYPASYKISSDPEPFKFRLTTDDPRDPTTARLIGETTTSGEAATFAVDDAVLSYVATQPGGGSECEHRCGD